MNIKIKYGFTLVELIIVITIISILSTIAFLYFSGFTNKARDSKRMYDITNLEKAVEIYSIKTGKYPDVETDNIAKFYGKNIFKYGDIDDNLSNVLNIKSLKTDEISNQKYIYGVTDDNLEFQVGAFLEDKNNFSYIKKAYANDEKYISLVEGNYDGLIKFSTGGKMYVANPPSLLLNNSGSLELSGNENMYFLVNNGNNIYHNIRNIDGVNSVLSKLNGSGATLTGVLIDSITNENIANHFTNENNLLVSFGGDLELIGKNIFGKNSAISYNNCEYNGFGFNHGENKVFYKNQNSFNCLSDSIIYNCNNGIILDNGNLVSGLTEYIYDSCIDDTTCRFDFGNLFDGSCHF